MKRLLCCIVLSAMLLTSCTSNTSTDSSNMTSTEESTQESQVEESTQKEYVRPEIDVPKPDDEEGTLYFTCKNWNSGILMMDTWECGKEFYIISLNPLNMEEIEITVPIQSDYTVKVTPIEKEELKMTEYNVTEDYIGSPNLFPFYIYQSYRGMDWKKMRELYDSIEDADRLLQEEIISNEEYSKIVKDYSYYQNLYKEDYEALTMEDLPTFYLYHVSIIFGAYTTEYDEYGFTKTFEASYNRVSETFHTIDIRIGDTIYTEEIGEVRLIAEGFPKEMYERNGIEITHRLLGSGMIPYGDGMICMNPAGFIAEEDLTINELYLYKSHMTPLMAYVQIKDERGNVLVDSKWDLQSPIYLEKGQEIEMRLIVQDENVMQLNYGGRCMAFVSYTVNGENSEYFFEQVFDSELGDRYYNGYWVVYASVFGGLSETLADYFYYYYPLYEKWRVGLE